MLPSQGGEPIEVNHVLVRSGWRRRGAVYWYQGERLDVVVCPDRESVRLGARAHAQGSAPTLVIAVADRSRQAGQREELLASVRPAMYRRALNAGGAIPSQ